MPKKIAIVYDWVDKWGGVERLLCYVLDHYPNADLFTSYANSKSAVWSQKFNIKTSFIQKFPNFIKKNRNFSLILNPFAFEAFNFQEYDVVISITSAFAKGVITHPSTRHICYLLTPPRYLWGLQNEYIKDGLLKIFSEPISQSLRTYDYVIAQRPDVLISESNLVSNRCRKYYNRQSDVLYPPFDYFYWQGLLKDGYINIRKFDLDSKQYYLYVGRIEPYKRVDLLISTFNQIGDKKLIIVGNGTQLKKLQKIAKSNIQFIQNVTDIELATLYQSAKFLLMPQEEEFGYTSLESQACGTPVLSYRYSGTSETIIEGISGELFESQTVSSIRDALERSSTISYNLSVNDERIKNHLINFSALEFLRVLDSYVYADDEQKL
ncbi:MAG: glycosyltransferase [Candidatus Roizmanbacteria bacterium]